jgi:acyl-CoA reductase-like NAD-dependent aldehyde dehydrogenase
VPVYQILVRLQPSEDPATGQEIGKVPEMGASETRRAIDAAAEAFKAWSKTTAKVYILKIPR